MTAAQTEVAACRQSPSFPADELARIERLTDRFAPVAAVSAPTTALRIAHEYGTLTADVSTDSRVPGLGLVKRSVRGFVAWYVRDVVQQVNAFAASILDFGRSMLTAIGLVGRQVDDVHAEVRELRERVARLEEGNQ